MAGTRIREFDGLRGAAVLTVVLGHYGSGIIQGVDFFNYASMGVDVFFVLSGFLIGGIILDGAQEEGFLVRFFRRRAARILPLYLVILACAFAAERLISGAPWADHLFPAWTYATFTMNIWSAVYGLEPNPLLGPAWSLAVEEKFYLIVPFLLPLVPKKHMFSVLGAACFAAIAFRYFFQPNIYAMELVLPARMDSLLIGVGVAFLQRNFDLARLPAWWKSAALAVPLIYLPLLVALNGKEFMLAHTFFALVTATYMLAVLGNPGAPSIFRARWLGFFAAISYGMYLIHEPVDVLLTGTVLGRTVFAPGLDRIAVTVASFGVTVGLAALSRRFFENPILQWESRSARRASTEPEAAWAAARPESHPRWGRTDGVHARFGSEAEFGNLFIPKLQEETGSEQA